MPKSQFDPREVREFIAVTYLILAVTFWMWALVAMLLGQVQEDSATLAIIGVGWAMLARR